MKIKLIMLAVICLAALSTASCTLAKNQDTLTLTYDDFTQSKNQARTIDSAHTGNALVITLPSNATTGFQWALSGISDKSVVVQEGKSQYELPDSTLAGAGGQEIWTFKTLKRGTSTISLEYSQAWTGGIKGIWTLTVSVTVK
jgi:predicted secreted protein